MAAHCPWIATISCWCRLCLAGAVLTGWGGPALGATSITPVIIDVPSDGRAIVTVRNNSTYPVLYQLSVMDWQVVDGADRYAATQDFIASPPLFTLAPSASQIVRLGYRRSVRQPLEQAYRLVLAEVPGVGPTADEGGRVDFAIQYLLPVFVAPSGRGDKAALTWSLREVDGVVIARALNPGETRTALNSVGLRSVHGVDPVPDAIRRRVTVLAHAWREWRFPLLGGTRGMPWHIVVLPSGNDTVVVVPDADMRPSAPP